MLESAINLDFKNGLFTYLKKCSIFSSLVISVAHFFFLCHFWPISNKPSIILFKLKINSIWAEIEKGDTKAKYLLEV